MEYLQFSEHDYVGFYSYISKAAEHLPTYYEIIMQWPESREHVYETMDIMIKAWNRKESMQGCFTEDGSSLWNYNDIEGEAKLYASEYKRWLTQIGFELWLRDMDRSEVIMICNMLWRTRCIGSSILPLGRKYDLAINDAHYLARVWNEAHPQERPIQSSDPDMP